MLSGSLDTFTVGQVLSLLGASGTTGALRATTDDDEGAVYCRDGSVTFATVGPSEDLGSVLVRSGALTLDRWRAVEAAPNQADGITALFTDPEVDVPRVRHVLARHVEDTVFELDRWTSGELRVEADTFHPLGGHVSHPIVDVLSSIEQRRPVWSELLRTIGSVDRIVHQVRLEPDDDDELRISRTQLMVITQIDGSRSVRELGRFLGTGLFRTAKVISALLDAGLVFLSADRSSGSVAGAGQMPGVHDVVAEERQLVAARSVSAAPTGSTEHGAAPAPGAVAPVAGSPEQGHDPEPAGPTTEFVEPGPGPAQDLILRLLSAVKEEL